jgi:hypothetical protein
VLIPNAGFLAVFVVWIGLWGLALFDVTRRSKAEIRVLGSLPRPAWIALIIALGPLGALAYLLYSRVRLHGQPRIS